MYRYPTQSLWFVGRSTLGVAEMLAMVGPVIAYSRWHGESTSGWTWTLDVEIHCSQKKALCLSRCQYNGKPLHNIIPEQDSLNEVT